MGRYYGWLLCVFLFAACGQQVGVEAVEETLGTDADSLVVEQAEEVEKAVTAEDIRVRKELLYDKYTLDDFYFYKKSKTDSVARMFQWDKVKTRLALLENLNRQSDTWGVIQNYKNYNGESPLVRAFVRNEYGRVSDTLGVERYQSVALYLSSDTLQAERYGRDGTPVKLINAMSDNTSGFYTIETADGKEQWQVTKKYVKVLGDTMTFNHAIFVDVTNQNVATLEKVGGEWLIRSMNPVTTGQHKPPYAHETPVGMYFIQEKKRKMIYNKDGSSEVGGFAPYASRFTCGAYLHGVPSEHPRTSEIEYSSSLGTTPRSHMCVRNASSHSQFVYEHMPVWETIVFILD